MGLSSPSSAKDADTIDVFAKPAVAVLVLLSTLHTEAVDSTRKKTRPDGVPVALGVFLMAPALSDVLKGVVADGKADKLATEPSPAPLEPLPSPAPLEPLPLAPPARRLPLRRADQFRTSEATKGGDKVAMLPKLACILMESWS